MPRILIVEDEQCISEALSGFCEALGYDSIPIADPLFSNLPCHDQKSCHKETPCVEALLVDQYLPSTFGLKFIRELDRKGCKIPIGAKAIMSEVLSSQEKEQATRLGCDVLCKPVTFEALKNWLEYR